MTVVSLVTHTAWLTQPVGPPSPIPDVWFVLKKCMLGGLDSHYWSSRGSPGASQGAPSGRESASAGDTRHTGSIPGLGRPPGVENGNPFWYSCLDNLMDRGACRAAAHGLQRVEHD